jgi:hypothetical protein
MAFLTPQQRADFVTYSNKAAGWFVVGAGATLIGIKEATDLVHALDWPSPITIPLVVLADSVHGPPHAPDPARAARGRRTEYCESLPCPCSSAAGGGHSPTPTPTPSRPTHPGCSKPAGVQPISFSKTKYPNIRAHFRAALRRGWPRTLVLNRPGADARRERLLRDVPTRAGYDRDEYPPALARGRGKDLARGSHPRGWKADVATSPAQRTAPTDRRSGSSCAASATAHASGR